MKSSGVKLVKIEHDKFATSVQDFLSEKLNDDDFIASAVDNIIAQQRKRLIHVKDTRIKALDFAQLPTASVLDAVFRPYRERRSDGKTKIERYIDRKQYARVFGFIIDYSVKLAAREEFNYDTDVRLVTDDFASEVDVLTDELINVEVKFSKSVYDEAITETAIQRLLINELNNVNIRVSRVMLVHFDVLTKNVNVEVFKLVFSDDYLKYVRNKMMRAVRVRDELLEEQSTITRIMRNMHFQKILEQHRAYTSLYRFYKKLREFFDNELVRIDVLDYKSENFIVMRV